MKRMIEYVPMDAETMVSRILVIVHQAIDDEFPHAQPAPSRFAKTVFGEEPTITKMLPNDSSSLSEDSLREASERRQNSRNIAVSNEEELSSSGETSYQGETLSQLRSRRLKQSLVGCALLLVCFVLLYIFW